MEDKSLDDVPVRTELTDPPSDNLSSAEKIEVLEGSKFVPIKMGETSAREVDDKIEELRQNINPGFHTETSRFRRDLDKKGRSTHH